MTLHSRGGLHSETEEDEEEDDNGDTLQQANQRQRVVNQLVNLKNRFHSYAFGQLASRAKADPMAKVKGMIEEMITKLVNELNQEVGQKAFCDEEMGKSKKALEVKSLKQDKLKNRLDKASSTKLELEEQIKELQSGISEIDKAQSEATKIRQQENAEFRKAEADYTSAENACAQAVEVLKNYYEGASLLQVKSSTRRADSEDLNSAQQMAGAQSGKGEMIIEFLEMSEGDFAKLLAEVETSEDQAVKEFDKISTENKVAKATKSTEVKMKISEA